MRSEELLGVRSEELGTVSREVPYSGGQIVSRETNANSAFCILNSLAFSIDFPAEIPS